MGALVLAAVAFTGCDDVEVEIEEPDFEIAVDFDFHDMVFDAEGRWSSSPRNLLFWPTFSPCYYKIDKPDWVVIESYYGQYEGGWNSDNNSNISVRCDLNESNQPRTGTVTVYVSNLKYDVQPSYGNDNNRQLDIPVYKFQESFTVTQKGIEDRE